MSYDETDEELTFDEMLIVAVSANKYDRALHLLEAGADPNCYDWFGDTPLQNATTAEMVQLLIDRGADPDQVDQKGRTAWTTLSPKLMSVMETAIAQRCRDALSSRTQPVSLSRVRRF